MKVHAHFKGGRKENLADVRVKLRDALSKLLSTFLRMVIQTN
jgi:hypothetical protein